MSTKTRAVEQFQLAFCQTASVRLPLADFALKGGGNLRFFMGSPRQSADLDFDYLGRGFETFSKRVDQALASRALRDVLRLQGLDIALAAQRSKDTRTVKRWKVQLSGTEMEGASTKIEFSNRSSALMAAVEQVDTDTARRLGGVAVRMNHYPPGAAVVQKIAALAGRSETQPRDVFDLDHLIRRYPEALDAASPSRELLRDAGQRALEIEFAQYRDLVVEYLDEEFVPHYGGEQAWSDMVLRLVDALERKAKLSHE